MKRKPMRCCVGCSVTGNGYADWCYGGRMNGHYFWPEFSVHFHLEVLVLLGLNWGLLATFTAFLLRSFG